MSITWSMDQSLKGETQTFSHIFFYYGRCSIPKPFSLTRTELDEHFGFPVYDAVEEVNKHYKVRLFAILAGG